MRLRWIAAGFALGVVTAILAGQAAVDDDDVDMQRIMERWQKYALPGEAHEKLELYAGKWDVTTKMWMKGPDKPPDLSRATVSAKPIFGGRFIESRMAGTISFELDGEVVEFPAEGIGYVGYDNFKQKYLSIWIDSGGTGIYYAEGTVDASGKVFTYFGEWDEWESGRRDVPYKMVDRFLDHDTVISEFHDLTQAAGRTKVFEMTASRLTR